MKILVLDNIRSAHNVGAMFRTAEAVGVDEVWLVGFSPCPTDRFGRPRPDIEKASVGAAAMVPWRHFETAAETIEELEKIGAEILVLEQTPESVDYKTVMIGGGPAAALIAGYEVAGVSPECVAAADTVMHIPMSGQKESLNVSVAAGIALYRLFDQN